MSYRYYDIHKLPDFIRTQFVREYTVAVMDSRLF